MPTACPAIVDITTLDSVDQAVTTGSEHPAVTASRNEFARELAVAGSPSRIRETAAKFRGIALGLYYAGAIGRIELERAWSLADRDAGAATRGLTTFEVAA